MLAGVCRFPVKRHNAHRYRPEEAGPNSLRNTVAAANSADTIVFAIPVPISITLGEIAIDKNLTINGPVGAITVQRVWSTGTLFRIFHISNVSNLIIAAGGRLRPADMPTGCNPRPTFY